MKNQKLSSIAAIIIAVMCSMQQSNATIWRVNNNSNYNGTLFGENYGGSASYPVFKTVDDALSSNLVSTTAGDTLHIEGSNNPYAGFTLTKQLTIIGAGYLLNENLKSSANGLPSISGSITFNVPNCTISGLDITSTSTNLINASNTTIQRCRFNGDLNIGNSIIDIFIRQNYFRPNASVTATTTSGNLPSNIYINNNIFSDVISIQSGITITELNNNIFATTLASGVAINVVTQECKNNILKNANVTVTITSTNIDFNISASNNVTGQFGILGNNIFLNPTQQSNTLFVAPFPVNSTDGQFQLQPAYVTGNLGSDGTQRGAFGGSNPYSLSGLEAIPIVYDVYTTGTATQQNGLPVTIKARTVK